MPWHQAKPFFWELPMGTGDGSPCVAVVKVVSKDVDREGASLVAHCSWCMAKAHHLIKARNHFGRRNIYTCSMCGEYTLPCIKCDIGMAKDTPMWSYDMCIVCDKSMWKKINVWPDEPVAARATRTLSSEQRRSSYGGEDAEDDEHNRQVFLVEVRSRLGRTFAAWHLSRPLHASSAETVGAIRC